MTKEKLWKIFRKPGEIVNMLKKIYKSLAPLEEK